MNFNVEFVTETTKNIDVSITRLIDGTVSYTPLTEEEQEKEKKIIEEKKQAINAKVTISNNEVIVLYKAYSMWQVKLDG